MKRAKFLIALFTVMCVFTIANDGINAMDIPRPTEAVTNKDKYDQMIQLIKEEIKEGELDSEEDVRNAVEKAREKFDLEITESEEEKIVDVMNTINDLGLDKNQLADKVEEVYNRVGNNISTNLDEAVDQVVEEAKKEIVETATEKVGEAVKKSMLDYIKDFKISIGKMISKIFGVAVG